MKFTSYKNWINERAAEKLEYGCLMLSANISNWNRYLSLINEEDLYITEDDDYGYEKDPHLTILYGIHDEKLYKEEFFSTIEKLMPIISTLSAINIFESDDYDVIKFEVPLSKNLLDYRTYFEKFYPNTQTFPEYQPHVTIAYVKKGEGKKYIQKIKPFKVIFNKAIYSYKGEKVEFYLGEKRDMSSLYKKSL